MDIHDVLNHGWMRKRLPPSRKWHLRYFLLFRQSAASPTRFDYYRDISQVGVTSPDGSIYIDGSAVVRQAIPMSPSDLPVLVIETPLCNYEFELTSQAAIQEWTSHLESQLSQLSSQTSVRDDAEATRTRLFSQSRSLERQTNLQGVSNSVSAAARSSKTIAHIPVSATVHVVRPPDVVVNVPPLLPISNTQNCTCAKEPFMYGDLSRPLAEEMLYGVDGAFLLRNSSQRGSHALSFMVGACVLHRILEHSQNGGFKLNGFQIPNCRNLTQVLEYLCQPHPEISWPGALTAYPVRGKQNIFVSLLDSRSVFSGPIRTASIRSNSSFSQQSNTMTSTNSNREQASTAPRTSSPPPPPRPRTSSTVVARTMNARTNPFASHSPPASNIQNDQPPVPPRPEKPPQKPPAPLLANFAAEESYLSYSSSDEDDEGALSPATGQLTARGSILLSYRNPNGPPIAKRQATEMHSSPSTTEKNGAENDFWFPPPSGNSPHTDLDMITKLKVSGSLPSFASRTASTTSEEVVNEVQPPRPPKSLQLQDREYALPTTMQPEPLVTARAAAPSAPEKPAYRAFESYSSADPKRLSFVEGDILLVIEKLATGWWLCELDGIPGWAPSTYLEEVVPDKTENEYDDELFKGNDNDAPALPVRQYSVKRMSSKGDEEQPPATSSRHGSITSQEVLRGYTQVNKLKRPSQVSDTSQSQYAQLQATPKSPYETIDFDDDEEDAYGSRDVRDHRQSSTSNRPSVPPARLPKSEG